MSHQSGCTPASFRHLPSASSLTLELDKGTRSGICTVECLRFCQVARLEAWGPFLVFFKRCRSGREHQQNNFVSRVLRF